MLNDLVAYAPILVVIAVLWAGHTVSEAIGIANQRRHEDHDALISELGDMRQILSDIEAYTSCIASVIDPPPTVDEMVAQYERTKP